MPEGLYKGARDIMDNSFHEDVQCLLRCRKFAEVFILYRSVRSCGYVCLTDTLLPYHNPAWNAVLEVEESVSRNIPTHPNALSLKRPQHPN
jgi:hypothetical protein